MGDDLDLVVELVLEDARFKRSLESIVRRIDAAESGVDQSTRNMANSWGRLEKRVGRTIKRIERRVVQFGSATATALATAFTGQAINLASQFERSVANVSTLLDDGAVSIERYRDQLLELSTKSSKDVLDLSQALYQTISAGIPAVEGAGGAFEFLDAAQRAAVAGLSTTEQAVDALATVVNAFGQENISAGRASDLLFEAVKRGRTTFPELAGALGRVAPVAASFNASTEEMLGLLVELTKAGLSTDESVTAVRSALLGFVRPTQKTKKELDKLGLSFSAQEIKTKGLVGVFRDLTEAVGGDADALAQLFPNVRALLPAVIATGDGFSGFEATVEGLTNAVGATDRALEKIKPTFSEAAAIFKSQLQAVLINAGQRVLPLVQKRVEQLGAYLTENGDRIANGFEKFVQALDSIASFVKESGATILKWIARVWAVTKIFAFTKAVGGAVKALSAFGGIGMKIASVLGKAGVVGAALGGAALLGQYIGEKIADSMQESFENSDGFRNIVAESERVSAALAASLKDRGAETTQQIEDVTAQVEAGTAIPSSGVDVGPTGGLLFRVDEVTSASGLVKEQGEAAVATAESIAAALREAGEIAGRSTEEYRAQFAQAAQELAEAEAEIDRRAMAISGTSFELAAAASLANTKKNQQVVNEIRAKRNALRVEQAAEEVRAQLLREQIAAIETDLARIDGRAESLFAGAKRLIDSIRGEADKVKKKREQEDAEEKKRRQRAARERADRRRGELARLNDLERGALTRRAALNRQAEEAEAARIQQRLAEAKAALEEELAERKRLEDGEREFADARLLSADELEARLRRVGASADAVAQIEAESLRQQVAVLDEISEQAKRVAESRKAEAEAVKDAEIKAEAATSAELRRKQPGDRKRIAELSRKAVEDIEEASRQKTERAEDDLQKKLADLGRQRLAVEQAIADARERQSDSIREQDDGLREALTRLRQLGDERGSDFLRELSRDALDVADGASREAAGVLASVLVDALTKLPAVVEDAAKEAFGDGGEGAGERVKSLIEDLVENIDEAVEAFEKIDDKILDATAQAAGDFSDAVGSAFEGGADRFVSAATAAAQSINEAIVAPLRALLGDGVASELVGGLLEIPGQIAGAIQSRFLSPFLAAVDGPLNELTSGFVDAVNALLSIGSDRSDERQEVSDSFDARLEALREGGASQSRIAALEQERERALSSVEPLSVADIVDGAFERAIRILDVISAELPALVARVVDRLIVELPRILSGVAQAITGVLNALVGRIGPLIESTIKALAAELPALIEAVFAVLPEVIIGALGGVVAIFERLPDIIDAFIKGLVSAAPRVIVGIIVAIPRLIAALIAATPHIIWSLISLMPRVAIELARQMAGPAYEFGRRVWSWASMAGETFWSWITRAATWLRDVFYSVGKFFSDIINGAGDSISDFGSWVASGFGVFHDGGIVGGGSASPMGVFHDGGVIGSMRSNLNGLARDESVNILQAGEVVLNRAAVSALGGPTNADRLNGRESPFSLGSPTVEIHAGDSALRALIETVVDAVVVNLRTPGGSVLKTATRATNGRIQGVR